MNEEIVIARDQGCIPACCVWKGPTLDPVVCSSFSWENGVVKDITPSETTRFRYGIIPGFVNAHTHIGDCFLPEAAVPLTLEEAFFRPHGYKYQALKKIGRDDHIDHMVHFLEHMASTGTVAHVDFREQGIEGANRLREASDETGVTSIILSQLNESPQSDQELASSSSTLGPETLAELKELLEVSDGFSESTMNDLSEAAWDQVRECVTRAEKASAIHCLESPAYRSVSVQRTGKGDLERALNKLDPDLLVHLTVANDEEIAMLAAAGKSVVLNPRANAALGLPLPPVADLMQAGVNLLLGTDNGILNGPDLFRELDFTYRLARSQWGDGRHPHPKDILKMVTSNFAKTVWGQAFPGTLETGLPATFSVIDLQKPAFQNSRDLTGTLLTRLNPEDLFLTVRHGLILHQI